MKKRSLIGAAMAAALLPVSAGIIALTVAPAVAAGGSGPYPADYETASTLSNHTIYRPDNLPSVRMPIFIWGEGGCSANGTSSPNFLRQIASYGYLVLASGSPNGSGSTTSALMTQSMDWAVSENSRQGSKYYGKLDTSKIAVAGWSCGGLEAYAVSNDSRVSTTMIFSSGLLNDSDDYQLKRLTKPIAYFIGGSSDIAYANAMDDWTKLPSGLPAWMGNLNVGHGGTYTQTNGGEFGRVAVLYLQWRFRGDTSAGANFVGQNCGLCTGGQWTVQQKNLTLGGTTTTTTTTSSPPDTWTTTTSSRITTTTTSSPPDTWTTTTSSSTSNTSTTSGGGGGACTATYSVQSQWPGGFVALVNVTAGSSGIDGWRVSLGLPGGASLSNAWNGVASGSSGTVTVTNQAYNGRLSAGQSTNFGFQGTGTGAGATVSCAAS
jgi:hypothetical protein